MLWERIEREIDQRTWYMYHTLVSSGWRLSTVIMQV
jgi:intergrase/recombinase